MTSKCNTNYFKYIGISDEAVKARLDETFHTLFCDPIEKFYFENEQSGYMVDTGNNDARSEGMSYGMMMAVQMNRKDIFDRLWSFTKQYMYQKSGPYEGYFAWSVQLDGTKNSEGPAPDGEEYFALALFFASARFGDGDAPFNYSEQGRDILKHVVHQHQLVEGGHPMWEPTNKLIKFVPEAPFTDPSYHLPHFYELFAKVADECDREFWLEAAQASRDFLVKACHPDTGMASEYTDYEGVPRQLSHDGQFYSDAYRVAMNIGLDSLWGTVDTRLAEKMNQLQTFFMEQATFMTYDTYLIDGTPLGRPALHPYAIVATLAGASIATMELPESKYALTWIQKFWELPLRQGERRYYDNCLYFFCLLQLAGEYKIYL